VRVLCAYTDLYPATKEALARYAPETEFVDVSGDDYAYWRAITGRWTGEDDLLVVEHDIEIHDQVIPQLEACEEPWCTFPYRLWRPDAWCYASLGCTRFSAELQRLVTPGEIQQQQAMWLTPQEGASGITYHLSVMPDDEMCRCSGRGQPPCWRHIDMAIADTLQNGRPGVRNPVGAHVHAPSVIHLPVDRPENEEQARVPHFPFDKADGIRVVEFPHVEPSRTHKSASLDDRPDWWPARAPGVAIKDPGVARELTAADARDPELGEENAAHLFATDKVRHGYFRAYQQIAAAAGPAGRVCEVGVWRGGSLKLWQALFPEGLVAGVDVDRFAAWPSGTVAICAEQDDPTLPDQLRAVSPEGWDLIVDDASHDGKLTRATFDLLWPLIRPGGHYVVEDWSKGLGVGPWWSDDTSMLECAASFLPLLDSRDCDPDFITYRHGLVILHRKAAA
jgi:hypothetical protein